MRKNIFVATSLLLFLPSMLNAASIRLSPVNVEILSDQTASSISLYNQSNESADLQVRIFEWTQNAGQDQLIPTDDIAISPPFLKLKPNDSYNLRVVRIKPEPISGEKTYRIIIDELPKPIESFCQLDSTSNVDFGNISDIGTTSRDYTAQGAINATCNNGTPYSIYLGDGNNRISGGFRRMTNGSSQYIPYQLYKDTAYSTVWDTTGGITAVGGSGGVSKTGSGTSQISNVYGKIPQGTAISSTPGNYSDSIVVTVTY